jgi:hypothetical protein
MRLEVKTWKNKEGKEGKSIKVGKMGAKGYGMIVGEEIEFECVFAPKIQEVDWKDPKTGKTKTFMGISVLAKPLNHLEFFEQHLHPEYGNIQLQLPNAKAVLQTMNKAEEGGRYRISLVEFVSKQDGETYIAFNCDQLDVIKKTEEPEETTPVQQEAPKEVAKPAPIVSPDYPKEQPKEEVKAPEVTDATDDELPW